MKLNETDPILRRIYFLVRDQNNALVLNATGFIAGELKTSANGAGAISAPGTFVAVGNGMHYYQATVGEATVGGFLWVRLDGSGFGGSGYYGESWAPVGQIFMFNETVVSYLRLPFTIYDINGAPVSGVAADGGLAIQKSFNGAAAAPAPGTLVQVTGFLNTANIYYYQGTLPEASVEGFISLFITSNISDLAIPFTPVAPQGGPTDGDPPVISNVDPPDGESLGVTNAEGKARVVQLDVTDLLSDFRLILLTLKYVGKPNTELVYNGTSFVFPYNSMFSVKEVIANGFRFKVLPITGWLDSVEQLFVYAVDEAGNLEGILPP